MTRRDRTGEPLPETDDREDDIKFCDGTGWIDRDADRPRPCPVCRPWLVCSPRRPPTPDETTTTRRCTGRANTRRTT